MVVAAAEAFQQRAQFHSINQKKQFSYRSIQIQRVSSVALSAIGVSAIAFGLYASSGSSFLAGTCILAAGQHRRLESFIYSINMAPHRSGDLEKLLLNALDEGHFAYVEYLISLPMFRSVNYDKIFRHCLEKRHFGFVDYLIEQEKYNPFSKSDSATCDLLIQSLYFGEDSFRYLLSRKECHVKVQDIVSILDHVTTLMDGSKKISEDIFILNSKAWFAALIQSRNFEIKEEWRDAFLQVISAYPESSSLISVLVSSRHLDFFLSPNDEGMSALHMFAKLKSKESGKSYLVVLDALEKAGKKEPLNADKLTPLEFACHCKNTDFILSYLEKRNVPKSFTKSSLWPFMLHTIALAGKEDLFLEKLNEIDDKIIPIILVDEPLGINLYQMLCRRGMEKAFDRIEEKFLYQFKKVGSNNRTLLQEAIYSKQYSMALKLLCSGEDCNINHDCGEGTALSKAISLNAPEEIIKEIFNVKDLKINVASYLRLALSDKNFKVAQMFLRRGDVNKRRNVTSGIVQEIISSEFTKEEKEELFLSLMENGFDVSYRSKIYSEGNFYQYVCSQGMERAYDKMQMLSPYDLKIVHENQNTLLEEAIYSKQYPMALKLLRSGQDCNINHHSDMKMVPLLNKAIIQGASDELIEALFQVEGIGYNFEECTKHALLHKSFKALEMLCNAVALNSRAIPLMDSIIKSQGFTNSQKESLGLLLIRQGFCKPHNKTLMHVINFGYESFLESFLQRGLEELAKAILHEESVDLLEELRRNKDHFAFFIMRHASKELKRYINAKDVWQAIRGSQMTPNMAKIAQKFILTDPYFNWKLRSSFSFLGDNFQIERREMVYLHKKMESGLKDQDLLEKLYKKKKFHALGALFRHNPELRGIALKLAFEKSEGGYKESQYADMLIKSVTEIELKHLVAKGKDLADIPPKEEISIDELYDYSGVRNPGISIVNQLKTISKRIKDRTPVIGIPSKDADPDGFEQAYNRMENTLKRILIAVRELKKQIKDTRLSKEARKDRREVLEGFYKHFAEASGACGTRYVQEIPVRYRIFRDLPYLNDCFDDMEKVIDVKVTREKSPQESIEKHVSEILYDEKVSALQDTYLHICNVQNMYEGNIIHDLSAFFKDVYKPYHLKPSIVSDPIVRAGKYASTETMAQIHLEIQNTASAERLVNILAPKVPVSGMEDGSYSQWLSWEGNKLGIKDNMQKAFKYDVEEEEYQGLTNPYAAYILWDLGVFQ